MTDEQLRKAIEKAQKEADRQALNLETLCHAIQEGRAILDGKDPTTPRVQVEDVLRFPGMLFVDNRPGRFANVDRGKANNDET